MRTALLLIAHGSRHSDANDDLVYLARQLRQDRGFAIVEASFLDIVEPTIDQGGASCVAQGAECLILVPYFLSAGIHVRRDLSAARARLADRFPQVKVCLAEPFGRHPLLVDLVVLRAGEAVQKGPQEKKSDTPGVST